MVWLALKARSRPIVSGAEEKIGARGTALENFSENGRVRVHGEEWQARTPRAVKKGQKLHVTGRDGLMLIVEPDHQSQET